MINVTIVAKTTASNATRLSGTFLMSAASP